MKKRKLLSILAVVFTVPVLASNGTPNYISVQTRQNAIRIYTLLILAATLAVYFFSSVVYLQAPPSGGDEPSPADGCRGGGFIV